MEGWNVVLLVFGGLVAGFMNTVAGGGSILALPLLMLAGLPADVANGTNRVAILLQNVAATAGFRHQGVRVGRIACWLAIPASVGALVGAGLAVSLDPSILRRVFGGVLGALAVLLVVQPRRWVSADASRIRSASTPASWLIFFGIGVYGGFVQAGVGFLFLTGLVLWMGHELVRANAIKVTVVLLYTAVALVIFFWKGQVDLSHGLILAVGNTAGGYAASVLSVKKGAGWVRILLVACALLASLKLLGLF